MHVRLKFSEQEKKTKQRRKLKKTLMSTIEQLWTKALLSVSVDGVELSHTRLSSIKPLKFHVSCTFVS